MGGYLPGRFCPADAPRNPPLNASSRRSLKSSVVSGAPEAAAEAVPTHTISANTAAPRPGNWCEWVRGEGYGFPVWGEDTGSLYLICGEALFGTAVRAGLLGAVQQTGGLLKDLTIRATMPCSVIINCISRIERS